MFAQLGGRGARRRPVDPTLSADAELLERGGPALWQEVMTELRRSHLDA